MKTRFAVAAAVAALALSLPAQFFLQTTLAGGLTNKGAMFDITNISAGPVVISSFQQNFTAAGTCSYEIYARTGGGSYVGAETTAGLWTLLGSAAGVAHSGLGVATAIPIPLSFSISAGATQGFYLTATAATASNTAYTAGAAGALNTVYIQDARIQIKVGVGKAYPFGTTTTGSGAGRVWNGRVNYLADGLFAGFNQSPSTGAAPMTVNFTDTSFSTAPGGVSLREWDFTNDGIVDSNATNPSFIYTTPGVYSVRLTVYDATHPSSSLLKTNVITVNPELLVITSTGAGDVHMSGPDDTPATLEGFLFLSTSIPPILGSGPFFGINFDGFVLSTLNEPAAVCNLLHYLPSPACFPNVNLDFPPGSVTAPGLTLDAVLVKIVPPNVVASNVVRVTF